MDFEKINNIESVFNEEVLSKDRETSILEFQLRIFDLVTLESTPLMEKLNFIKIISSNLEEFISIRLPDIPKNKMRHKIHMIEAIYTMIGKALMELNLRYGKLLPMEDRHKLIVQRNFDYIYSGDRDHVISKELDDTISIKEYSASNYLIYSGKKPSRIENNVIISEYIKVPHCIMMLDDFIGCYRGKLQDEKIIQYKNTNFYKELRNTDMTFRVPYESYDYITEFIHQMCTNENILAIFITLYRTAKDSVIIDSLIEAKNLGKDVFVYIEPSARGDEYNNIRNIQKLLLNRVNVSCSYFNYKVHSKVFCAVSRDGVIYSHIGTGNYNENTAKIYTDTHLLTTNYDIGINSVNILLSIFNNKVIVPRITGLIGISPVTFRSTFVNLIDNEIEKGVDGKIYIKCNNMCDRNIIHKLYTAARAGVDVKIICRTGCAALPMKNLEIRSKVGRYLEHDRLYIFGNRCFISSADLLLRNISKRVEVVCELDKLDAIEKTKHSFEYVWNTSTHELLSDGRWSMIID